MIEYFDTVNKFARIWCRNAYEEHFDRNNCTKDLIRKYNITIRIISNDSVGITSDYFVSSHMKKYLSKFFSVKSMTNSGRDHIVVRGISGSISGFDILFNAIKSSLLSLGDSNIVFFSPSKDEMRRMITGNIEPVLEISHIHNDKVHIIRNYSISSHDVIAFRVKSEAELEEWLKALIRTMVVVYFVYEKDGFKYAFIDITRLSKSEKNSVVSTINLIIKNTKSGG